MDDELGTRFECDQCNLAFYVLANNDAEIMAGAPFVIYCPRCGERLPGEELAKELFIPSRMTPEPPPMTEERIERIVSTARHLCYSFDEFGHDPGVLGFDLECLEAAIDGRAAPRDEDPPQ